MKVVAISNQVPTPQPAAEPISQPDGFEERQVFLSRPRFTVRHAATVNCVFEPHSHSAFTVTAVLAGHMSASIDECTFEVSEGEAALTNIGQSHAGRASEVEFVSIGVGPVLVNELVAEIGLTRTTADIVFRTNLVRDEALNLTIRAIAAEIFGDQWGHDEMLDALVRQLVIHLLRFHLTVRMSDHIELSRAGPVDRRLRRAIEFMHDNFGRELALEEIASAAYLSEYHFARLFKQITRVTPHVYLANLRLEQARKLLAETALPISEIAATVGYQSQSHFSKMFKAVAGITPRAFREASK